MPFQYLYLLKLSVSIAIVYLFYYFVLRRLTFHNWKRFYLLCYTLVSFLIPFINIMPILEKIKIARNGMVQLIPAVGNFQATAPFENLHETFAESINWSARDWTLFILLTGMFILLTRLGLQLLSFKSMMKKARFISDNDVKLYEVDQSIIPFSFGKSIFINSKLHPANELQEIIRHEFVHIRQLHTIDIIWSELLCIVNWFNPFAWLIRKTIRENLEFIADDKVLQAGIDRKQYQYLLLKVTGSNHLSIASQFNFSSLKKRIAMMNKMKSARAHLIKFLFVLPIIAVLLVAFRNKSDKSGQNKESFHEAELKQQPANILHSPDTVPGTDNYIIEVIVRQKKGSPTIVVVKDKKTKKELKRMTLVEWDKNKEQHERLYGPVDGVVEDKNHAELITTDDGRNVYAIRSDESDTVKFERLEITNDNKVKVSLKDGSTEKYDLDNKLEKGEFEKKYGKIFPGGRPAKVVIVADQSQHAVVAPARVFESSSVSIVRNDETTALAPTPIGGADVTQVAEPVKTIVVEDNVIAIFKKNMQEADVKKIETDLKGRGYDFKITKAGYDNSGKLILIRGHITKHNHKQYFNASDFSRLIITDSPENTDEDHFNFLVEQGRLSVNDTPDWQ